MVLLDVSFLPSSRYLDTRACMQAHLPGFVFPQAENFWFIHFDTQETQTLEEQTHSAVKCCLFVFVPFHWSCLSSFWWIYCGVNTSSCWCCLVWSSQFWLIRKTLVGWTSSKTRDKQSRSTATFTLQAKTARIWRCCPYVTHSWCFQEEAKTWKKTRLAQKKHSHTTYIDINKNWKMNSWKGELHSKRLKQIFKV